MALSSLLIDARAALSQRADELFVPVGDAGEKKIILFFSISAGRRRARVGQVVGASFAEVWQKGASMVQRLAARHKVTVRWLRVDWVTEDRKSTRLNSSHVAISYAVFCLKKKMFPGTWQ